MAIFRYSKNTLIEQLRIKPQAFDFLQSVMLISEDSIISFMGQRMDKTLDTIALTIGGKGYSRLSMLEMDLGRIPRSEIVLNHMTEPLNTSQLLKEYLDYHSNGKVRIGDKVYSIHEALSKWGISIDMIQEMHTYTGIPYHELTLLTIQFREAVDHYYYNKVGKRDVQVLEKVEPVVNYQQYGYTPQQPVQQPIKQPVQQIEQVPKPKPIVKPQQPKPTVTVENSPITFRGATYPNLDTLASNLIIDKTLYLCDRQKGMGAEQAIAKQVDNKGTHRTKQAVMINGIPYNSQRAACAVFGLDETKLTFYKSQEGCSTYEALIYFIEQKYGKGLFR